ncbi:hypothetical protein NA57DRAFT_76299 [Rhizodiscina lignyota]|uniref:Integral membrane protein n=1 Tax=Rhizodiscina lignyota TaxID=1504668 RepID=A0A9P4IFI3_9PEZI|nr:hypothetical protein NA57DRAFT_76299 [Rhizodiscina lignyota]
MASATFSRPSGLLSVALIFLTTLGGIVNAQTVLDSSKLPSCYTQCQPLTQANGACVPPAAPVTDQGTYQSCFCASQFLVALYSSPTLQNCAACSASDQSQIQTWYESLCHGGVVVTPAGGQTQTTTASSSTQGAVTTTTGAASAATSGSESGLSSNNPAPKPWFSTHWKWVVLLIVVVLAFIFFMTLGFWLKRRNRHRRDNQRFSGTGQLRNANSPSPFSSGILAPSDGAFIGSRNHPPMSVVPGAGSAAAMERYGSGSNVADGYGYSSVRSQDFDVPNPPPATAGATRNLPWLNDRTNSGGSGRSKRGAAVAAAAVGADEIAAEGDRHGRKSKDGSSLKKKLSRKSKSRSRRRDEDR